MLPSISLRLAQAKPVRRPVRCSLIVPSVGHLSALCNQRLHARLPDTVLLSAVVADNAPNYQGAASLMSGEPFGCAAHACNLVVKHTVEEELGGLESKVRVRCSVYLACSMLQGLVAFFRRSTLAQSALRRAQAGHLQPGMQPVTFTPSVPTRWNSTLHMFTRFNRLYPHLRRVVARIENEEERPLPGFEEVMLSKKDAKLVAKSSSVHSLALFR